MPDSTAFYEEDNKVSSIPEMERQNLAQMYSKKWMQATDDIRTLINDSRLGWDFYLKNSPDPKPSASRQATKLDAADTNITNKQGLRFGLIPKTVDSVVSILHNSIFPADEKFFRATPKNEIARRYQELYEQYRADNFAEDNATEQLRRYLLTLCIDPAAAIAATWQSRKRKKVTYEPPSVELGGIKIPLPVLGLKKKVNKDFVEWEGTHFECLDFNDWRVDPFARSMDESFFMRRWYLPTWKVEEEFGIKDVKAYHDAFDFPDDPLGNQKLLSSGLVRPIPFEDEEEGKEKALLMIVYDDFIIDGKVYKNHAAVFLNGQDMVWFDENPYNHGMKPYVVHSLLPIPNQIYGLSLIKHAIPSAAIVDTAVEKELKIGALAADPIFEVDMMEPAFRKSRTIKPGMTFPVKKQGAIRQIQVNVANLSLLENLIDRCEENIREVTGVNQAIAGEGFEGQPANITAFQVDQHMQGASQRFTAIQNNFCNGVLEPLLKMTHENDKQFKEETEWLAIGDDEHELTPDLIKQMEFKWLITSNSATTSRGKRLANLHGFLMNMAPMLVQSGIMQLTPEVVQLDAGAALKQMLTLAGEPNADLLLKVQPLPQGGMPNGVPPIPNPGTGPNPGPPGSPPGQPPLPGPQVPNAGPPLPGPQPQG